MNKRPYKCCNKKENMETYRDKLKPELEIQKCRVCGRRHFKLIVEEAKYKMVIQGA